MSCPDQPGIVSAISSFISANNGNILHLEQHVDSEVGAFFMRVEWEVEGFAISRSEIKSAFAPLGDKFTMDWALHFSDIKPRVAIFVTKDNHCIYDLLSRHESGELPMEVPLIISNRMDLKPAADRFGIPFYHFPITKATKAAQEAEEIALLKEHRIDTVVLARYMQILSSQMVDAFPSQIINIHHSFLPAFPGARPYHSAHARGVKLIGATSHYVTEELDEGPIIAQDVIQVSHRNSVKDFVRKGKDLEQVVLSRAVWNHLRHRVLPYQNQTVVFG
ncbi:UNVERIFIED_CONTAM: hypothetical protein GTU68_017119 [Idotea baltica]|nr:hypothetical protein [Idotea baltica]